MPFLSVIVPTYNSQHSIQDCLKSIRNSLYKDYELIIVDDSSGDKTIALAEPYADRIVKLTENSGWAVARQAGISAAKGEIIVNVDSDILIRPDTLVKIKEYFSSHKDVDALTGILSKECPDRGFFSQYKNLYMHYIFRRLPERVTFVYGSIYAARKEALADFEPFVKIADDTAFGQQLVLCGRQIAFLPDLEVVHLKQYNIFSFIKNDFRIPFDWARLFIRYKGWKELLQKKAGFAHASNKQIISVLLIPLILCLGYFSLLALLVSFLIWFFLNLDFIIFLGKERGRIFAFQSCIVTFFDQLVMGMGIFCGCFSYLFFRRKNE